jgi:ribose transport system permease protein
MVIITGGIDLSIGSMIALCGVMLVQVINVRYEPADFESTIAVVQPRPPQGSSLARLRLTDPPPELRDGDRLVYRSTTGSSAINVSRKVEIDGETWVETRDNLRLLRRGIAVQLETMRYTPPLLACSLVLAFAALLGWVHGVLITRANLQPFVVTLCGLLIYRGLARVWTGDDQVGLLNALADFKSTATGAAFQFPLPLIGRISGETDSLGELVWIDFPVTGVLLAIVALLGWLFLNRTVWGRHLLATGENEQAARYSGVATARLTTFAYVVCGFLSGMAGILFILEWNSVQPGSSGAFYELYAIAAAVLGGCSLRGGRGAIIGVIAGAAVMRCLYKAIVVLGIPQEWEMVIIGAALLLSVLVD